VRDQEREDNAAAGAHFQNSLAKRKQPDPTPEEDDRAFRAAMTKGRKEDLREAQSHCHLLTHNALELQTPDAHKMAEKSHRDVAKMHRARAAEIGR
jgi:hypothetical protein